MKPKRTSIAAGGTMVVLGALGAVAIAAAPGDPVKAVSAPTAQPVEVRTVVVHRTIHVVRQAKPKRRKPVAAPPAVTASAPPIQVAPVAQPTYHPVATPPAPASATKPLTTSTSGSGKRGGDDERENDAGSHNSGEHEGGGDD